MPALDHGALVASKRFLRRRQQLEVPTMHGRMIRRDASLSCHLFRVSKAQPINHISAHARRAYIKWATRAFERVRHGWIHLFIKLSVIYLALPPNPTALSKGARRNAHDRLCVSILSLDTRGATNLSLSRPTRSQGRAES